MKKLTVLITLLAVLAFASVCDARPHFKMGKPFNITCHSGQLSFKTTITNDGDEDGTVTGITLDEVSLYCDGDLWWKGFDRDLGDMAYYVPAGGSKTIRVNLRSNEIDRFDGSKYVKFRYHIHWGRG